MPRWIPEAIWMGQEVFIIGGGDSLRTFDWSLLELEWTIGCNTAFVHGKDVCKICVFGDFRWFDIYKHELEKYQGTVFTNAPHLLHTKIPWLWTMGRKARGLHRSVLGWNKNTGALAINLALLLGASKIYLLGFDMKLSSEGLPNWHNRTIQAPDETLYPKFREGFRAVERDLKAKWPKVEVINVTDNSALDCFPKIGVKKFWNERNG